jgi:hypothetical protein
LTSRLRIDQKSEQRIAGQLELSASGMISPTTNSPEKVDLVVPFDTPIIASDP